MTSLKGKMCDLSGTSFNRLLRELTDVLAGFSLCRDRDGGSCGSSLAVCLKSSVSACVLIALGKQQSRKDEVHDNGEPGGRLEDAGPLLQVGRTWTRCGEAWLSGN